MKRAIASSPLYGNAVHHRTRLASMLGITPEPEEVAA